MDRSEVAIIIPALNESATIKKVIIEALNFGNVILVNDGSTDDTANVAHLAGAIVVNHKNNLGYDAALNSGFIEANSRGYKYFITIDADGQHNPKLIRNMLDELSNGAYIVSGIRDKKQRIGEYLFDFYTYIFFSIRDPLCGLKAYRAEVYQDMQAFDTFKSIGTELLIYSSVSGYKITQIKIITSDREDEPRFKGSVIGNYRILRALFITIKRALFL